VPWDRRGLSAELRCNHLLYSIICIQIPPPCRYIDPIERRRNHTMTTSTRHVLIVGAGLAGPCLALSLAQRNIRSTIFELRPGPSTMGGSISLGPNALQVLDRYAGVYDRVSAAGFTYRRFGAYFDDGEKFGDIAVGEESKGEDGYPSVRILRMALHKVLLEAAEESGMIDVRFGKRFLSIEEDEEGVTVYFDEVTAPEVSKTS
jgi:2-polyprenyl-6-methoxyphenol hydroxylase-like FAD-dependent oxidoreductase